MTFVIGLSAHDKHCSRGLFSSRMQNTFIVLVAINCVNQNKLNIWDLCDIVTITAITGFYLLFTEPMTVTTTSLTTTTSRCCRRV